MEHHGRGRTQADRGGARGAVGRRAAARRVTAGVPQSLAGSPAAQARLLLGMYPWKGYTLVEEDAASVSCVSCSFVATLLFLALPCPSSCE